jgi:hypothetical protein
VVSTFSYRFKQQQQQKKRKEKHSFRLKTKMLFLSQTVFMFDQIYPKRVLSAKLVSLHVP